jgi:hypothetical protein
MLSVKAACHSGLDPPSPYCLNFDCLNLDFHKISLIALIYTPLFIKVPLVAGYKTLHHPALIPLLIFGK